MKRNAIYFLLCLAMSLAFAPETSAQNRRSYGRDYDTPEQSFVVAVAPISLLLRNGKFNVRGEWAYADNKSLSLLVNVPLRTKVPGWLTDNIDLTDGKPTTNTYTQVGAVLENRFYLTGEAPRGFYLAPYLRYNHFSVRRVTENTSNGSETTIGGALGGFGAGAAAGWQFRMGKAMTMDITFIGLDYKWMRGTITYETNDPDNDVAEFRDQVQEKLEDIPFIGDRISAQIDGDKVKVHTPGMMLLGYRFNLTVGYAF